MTENKKIHVELNCETGEEIIREFTQEEYMQHDLDSSKVMAERELYELEQKAKADAKASAHAKLTALGLTIEEISALSSNI